MEINLKTIWFFIFICVFNNSTSKQNQNQNQDDVLNFLDKMIAFSQNRKK